MKKLLAVTMILAILAMQTGFAMAEEPFSLRGVTFGASMDEVKSILGEGEGAPFDYGILLRYHGVSVSKFTDTVDFVCVFVDNRVVCMFYSLWIEDNDYEYLEYALIQKYGQKKNIGDHFTAVLSQIFQVDGVGATLSSTWQRKNDVMIGTLRGGGSVQVFYLPFELPDDYNTYGL